VTVACPACDHHLLRVLRGCRATTVLCPRCAATYSLGELAQRLEAEAFERLAEAVGEHFADRV
jgi:uncharacterized protein YbaR (Trm112 family)